MIPYLWLAAIALTGLACVAAALWSGQLPWLRVVAGAEPTGPAGGAPLALAEPYNSLPGRDNAKAGARMAALDPQQDHRDYEASVHAGLVEGLDTWDQRRASLLAHMTEADAAASLLDRTIPAQTRTED